MHASSNHASSDHAMCNLRVCCDSSITLAANEQVMHTAYCLFHKEQQDRTDPAGCRSPYLRCGHLRGLQSDQALILEHVHQCGLASIVQALQNETRQFVNLSNHLPTTHMPGSQACTLLTKNKILAFLL
jgi:hypothetical protein